METIALKKLYSGKVRELYEVDKETILLVATDRVSAFDFILPTVIPDKGRVLTQLSVFWFRYLRGVVGDHLIEGDFSRFPDEIKKYPWLEGRSIIVKRVEKIPIECVVRGYLAGSGWKEYEHSGTVCGVSLPSGLRMSEQLPEPIFTPATKEEMGTHDRNVSYREMTEIVGEEAGRFLRDASLELYRRASAYAGEKGIILADTKFEFGMTGGAIILIDEIFTPDSSRFWERSRYEVGGSPESFDKQYIRDYLESLRWDKKPPVPPLPPEVVQKTREKYNQIYTILVGEPLQ